MGIKIVIGTPKIMHFLAIIMMMMMPICLALPAPDTPLDPGVPWFGLQTQDRFIHKGCDLRLNNVCGCTAFVDIDYWHECKSSNRKKTQFGPVCGGTWTVGPGEGWRDSFSFEKGDCRKQCSLASTKDNLCYAESWGVK
ncbi:MAG: hypothetical protein Q9202_001678 [Teloschistes flavicans]